MTRKELDHARHLRQREQRLRKQHEYYLANKEKYTWRHLYEVYENQNELTMRKRRFEISEKQMVIN